MSNTKDINNNISLVGKHKKFDKRLYEKYDLPAREVVKSKLKDFVIDNPNPYEQDLVITKDNYKYKYIELQVCTAWVGDKIPYDNVYVFERKARYGDDTLFITLNKHLTQAYVFDAISFKNNKPRRIKKYSRYYVYDVPWNRIMEINIDCLDMESLMLY